MNTLRVKAVPEGVSLEVHLQPRSSRSGAGGVRDGALELRVHAPPLEGRANEAARKLLAELLDVSRSRVDLTGGGKSRRKVFLVKGLSAGELRRRLGERLKSS